MNLKPRRRTRWRRASFSSGGTGPYTYALTAGRRPPGLVSGDGLLGHAQRLRQLRLGDAVLFGYSNFNRTEHARFNQRIPDFLHGLPGLLAYKH